MNCSQAWYIVKQDEGHCEVVMDDVETIGMKASEIESTVQRWGPFDSSNEAIARRVGLIRTGKCQPIQPAP